MPLRFSGGAAAARLAAVPPAVIGMACMVVATFCFSGMSAMVRFIGQELHPFEIAFWRLAAGACLMAPVVLANGGIAVLKTRRPGMHLLRNALQAIDMLAWFLAVTLIPLAEATALTFTAPLFATLLAVLLLGERIRWRRVAALLAGFAGVLVAVRPGFVAVDTGSLLVLFSTLFWAATMIVVKSLTRTESSLTITAYMTLLMMPMALIAALPFWQGPTWEQLGWCVVMGFFGTIGHLAFAQAFKLADIGATLPLDYLRLVWATLLGFVLFAELPAVWYLIGGTIIFASATYISIREARLARRGAQ